MHLKSRPSSGGFLFSLAGLRELKLSQKDLNEFFVDKAHLALNDGEMFGKEGIGFMRLNVASPRCIIEKAMKQLADAYQLYIK